MKEFICFLEGYVEIFEQMEQKQVEKLGLLLTKELDKIEQSIMIQQAMDKQIENMEKKRIHLLESLGLAGKSLKELMILCDDEEKQKLMEIHRRLDGAIGNIRYYNEKAESVAKTELDLMGTDVRLAANPTGIYGPSHGSRGHKFEKNA